MNTLKTTPTPELDKMLSNKDKSQTIGEFLDWLMSEKKVILCVYDEKISEHHPYPIRKSIEELLAEYYGIDLKKCEKERMALLNNLRKINNLKP